VSAPSPQAVAQRAVKGSLYNLSVSGVTVVLGFVRAVLLARLLLPEHFGIVTLALFYVALVAQLQSFGFEQALISLQRDDETTRGTYFALRLAGTVGCLVLIAPLALILSHLYPTMPGLGWATIALGGIHAGLAMAYVHETFLRRDLAFRQLAMTDLVASIAMTIVAPLLAWMGFGLWALIAEQGSGTLTRLAMNWLVFRRWTPRLSWDNAVASRLWAYGKHLWAAGNLIFLNDRFDDFWTGSRLGGAALGFYSRAYEFAHYPRRVVVNPLLGVMLPTFARLQDDRLRLSQAFFRSAHLILRTNCLVSIGFGLVIPEFVALVIGPQWTPVIWTFRLMVVYALLDAMMLMGQALVQAVGQPRVMTVAVAVQTIVFIPLVIVGAQTWGINGVALAADVMMVVGIVVLYRGVQRLVDFSTGGLVMWPLAAVVVGVSAATILEMVPPTDNPWAMGAVKLVAFAALYGGILVAAERHQFEKGLRWAWQLAISAT
jgi:O-antigen/teichoic acid export membrane protein